LKFREVRRLLREDGWELVRQSGSHEQYRHPTKLNVVTVAGRDGADIPRGAPMIYRIEFEDADDGGVGAYLPDMPGVSVVGETRSEALEMLDQAVRWHVEALLADGTALPVPAPHKTDPGQWSLILNQQAPATFSLQTQAPTPTI